MKINLTKAEILRYAKLYDKDIKTKKYRDKEDVLSGKMKRAAKRKYMTPNDLEFLARWKWPPGRAAQFCKKNRKDEVKDISAASFRATTERLRIGALRALRGVDYPIASVILHFAFPERYPILDRKTMKAVGGSKNLNFERWQEYLELCQKVSKKHKVKMRTLDKALWKLGEDRP